MTEADIYSALSECEALNDLALFNGRRAIFCGAPPDDVDLCGYPRCVFDLDMQAGMRRATVPGLASQDISQLGERQYAPFTSSIISQSASAPINVGVPPPM